MSAKEMPEWPDRDVSIEISTVRVHYIAQYHSGDYARLRGDDTRWITRAIDQMRECGCDMTSVTRDADDLITVHGYITEQTP